MTDEEPQEVNWSDPQEAFGAYTVDPSPANMTKVMGALQPAVNQSLAQIGESGNPMLQEKARMFAVKAVKTYDPAYGATLHTWTRNQLRQLTRAKREMNSPMKVPDRTQLDAFHLRNKELEFVEKHGREPDLAELADASHLPIKRIEKVRRQFMKVPGQGAISDDTVKQYQTDYTPETMDYVYEESDHVDRKLMEHRLGYGGAEILPNNVLAKRLNLRPDVLSKRWGKINHKLNEVYESLSNIYN